MPKLLNVALERNQLFYFLMPAVKEIFQIVKFLRDFISSSISSLNISAFYMSVPYKPVPYKKKACSRELPNISWNSVPNGYCRMFIALFQMFCIRPGNL